MFKCEYLPRTLAIIAASNEELARKIDNQYGFLIETDIPGLIAVNPALSVLVRTGKDRFVCRVDEVSRRIAEIEENYRQIEATKGKPAVLHGADFVRDVSLPVDEHQAILRTPEKPVQKAKKPEPKPVYLTARQQNLLAEVAQHISNLNYNIQTGGDGKKQLDDLLNSWIILESRSQEWGELYDIMHRSGENA